MPYKEPTQHRARHRLHVIASRQRHPDHERARSALNRAIASGVIAKTACHCGEAKVQGHHHLGYEPEHWLDVQWLCSKHHGAVHRQTNPNSQKTECPRGHSYAVFGRTERSRDRHCRECDRLSYHEKKTRTVA